ncbi:histidine phosphatase family protein [Micromonospora sp. NPDC092111]|uniref:histidine phosphatase family protein n=1 Tax=Micromonospora sp. NPDC092111 TaxID=3364289 RepID=UPI00381108F4
MDAVAGLTIVRHGQSVANVAFADAHARGVAGHELTGRDADVELSPLGWQQATQLGHWLAARSADERPDRVVCSPYLRARQTWTRVAETAGALGVPCPPGEVDVRLGDRLMGDLELLTPLMIADRFPAEAARLAEVGLYAYRPPGGETYDDVAARVRAVLADLNSHHAGSRVWVVAHDAVVVAVRHILEGLSFADLDAILATTPITNTSLTRYAHNHGRLDLVEFAATPRPSGKNYRDCWKGPGWVRYRQEGETLTRRGSQGMEPSPY